MSINLIQVPVMITRGDTDNEFITITGETTSSPHFAITPAIRRDQRGTYLGWGTSVTHIPTGLTLPTGGADKRKTVEAIKDLIDWSSQTPLADPADKKLITGAVRALVKAEDDPWPEWAGDETTPALSLLAGQLEDATGNYDKRRDARTEIVTAVAELDEDLAKKVRAALDATIIGFQVQTYGLTWLLAVLMQLDPTIADQAARGLVTAWEDGALDEHIYEWRDDIACDRQPTLRGITFPTPSLNLDAVRPGSEPA
ncbi:hypothetical protein [Rhodococcus globerulus]|uniref:Uncharacterized protein n=1 Tax=Rhodococcus globerulus TaxID=33008 RepID=A0ABU4BS88_RHOGO|nr:hypothetical protein [Rhodococcus globerulus]MDV6267048.1 hypothetical protein [Rhodococcus globerulus]